MRSRLLLSGFALGALAVLIGLGTWQMKRLQWKNALVAKIETRLGEQPATIAEILNLRQSAGDIEYRPVMVQGVFDHAKARHVYALGNGKAGWHIYTPLKLGEKRFVFVNRGFFLDPLGGTAPRLVKPEGTLEVRGLVRTPPSEKGIFTPANDLTGNKFYWRDFSNMVASVHDKTDVSFAPFFIDEAPAAQGVSGVWPRPGTTRVNLSNRHLEYAITWYGLALALVGVYAFFMFGGRRDETS